MRRREYRGARSGSNLAAQSARAAAAEAAVGPWAEPRPAAMPRKWNWSALRLGDAGYREGSNLAIEYRWANDDYARLPMLAEELVRSDVALIITVATTASALAAKAATATIPVVFVVGADPVAAGLVPSLSRPGGNLTGMTLYSAALTPKRIDLLRTILPKASVIAMLVNPTNPTEAAETREGRAAVEAGRCAVPGFSGDARARVRGGLRDHGPPAR